MKPQACKCTARERGAATLLMSLVLLTLITVVTLYTSKTVFLEQKIANSDVRAKQAFEVAEAGLSEAVAYLRNGPDQDNDGVLDTNLLDSNGDGTADSATTTVDGNPVTVTVTDLSGGSMTALQLTAVGFSDDRSASKTIVQVLATINPLPNAPSNPMTTRGSVVVTGSATVHNPEGHSTIWSGGDVDLGSNNSTSTEVADPTDPNYPGCMDVPLTCNTIQSSNKVTVGLDVIEYDANLANLSQDEFFENFFGMTPAEYRSTMVTLETTPADVDTDIDLATQEVIWVEGDTSFGSVTVGCTESVTGNNVCPTAKTKPSIIIVNGDATFSGNPQFYGIIFVLGSINVSGNTTIYGSLVTAGDVQNSTGGSLDIYYNSDVLEDSQTSGPSGSSSGTWRDFS